MSLKAELETWVAALNACEEEDFEKALELFSGIADFSKILMNMGLIYATLGDHEAAIERFIEATGLDTYLAVAYFQCGVSNFLLAEYELAYKNFEDALLYLRGNQEINYEQLGLNFRLYSAEVLFNQGLSLVCMGRLNEGLMDMEQAKRAKATDEHDVIDDAIADRGQGFTVFSIPVGVLFRPPAKKVENAKTKDYLGKAKLIAASDARDTTVGFSGMERLQQGITPSGIYIDGANRSRDDGPSLTRSKTTPNPVVTKPSGLPARSLSTGSGPMRSNTVLNTGRPSPNVGIGGPVRGLSVRRGGSPLTTNKPLAALPPPVKEEDGNDIYADYFKPDEPAPSMLKVPQPEHGLVRSRSIASVAPTMSQRSFNAGPRIGPTINSAPSSYGGGSVRRRLTRRNTSRRIQPKYEEEEEGYVSGEDWDGPFELIKIRVKLHYDDDVRGMALTPGTPFAEFLKTVTEKFGKSINELTFKFQDEDGTKVSLLDESDYDLAIETARESSNGKPEGKLVIWCSDAYLSVSVSTPPFDPAWASWQYNL
ncbi:P-type phospholipid transporter [Mycena sanguinolenta]|uniref:P-type phospholipid transporter n=1 Tax=Mycena sanguinolenta TaxID=230812 RepID=A0A8H6ZFE8_9AGAR|nr:P-type phospholipid transporter [Mycena sanguinolenta]